MKPRSEDNIIRELLRLRKRISELETTHSENLQGAESFARRTDVDTIISELSYALMTSGYSIAGISNIVLNYAKGMSNSANGYVSTIDPDTGDNICHTLTGMIGDTCKIHKNVKGIIFPIDPDGKYTGLWGHSLNSRVAFYTNEPGAHEASTGFPTGHIPIRNFLSVPAIIGNKMYGQISLANATNGYTDTELDTIKRFAAIYALAIRQQRNNETLKNEIRKRKQLENELGELEGLAVRASSAPGPERAGIEDENKIIRVLLENQGIQKKEIEKTIKENLEKLILPYIEKLTNTALSSEQEVFLGMIRKNIEEIFSPFVSNYRTINIQLTPQELQVASLIKSGLQSKEISNVLNISVNAINFHRKNIREKFGLSHKRINLRSYLLSLENS